MRRAPLDDQAEKRLQAYLDDLGEILRDKRQRASFALYATELLAELERKSMAPIAARLCGDPTTINAMHHKLIHFLGTPAWQDAPIRRTAAGYAVSAMETREAIGSWIIDDTGFLKCGKQSPGVQRQYTGSAGKQVNCQIGVSVVLANRHTQIPVDFRLYIPQSWAEDGARCRPR